MTLPAPRLLALAATSLFVLAGCTQQPRSRATTAALQKCRVEVDRVYAAQNRVDLSTRDTRDTPFASNYLSGITSRGLGAQYGRENMTQSCVNEATTGSPAVPASPAASTGPTFSTTPTSTVR